MKHQGIRESTHLAPRELSSSTLYEAVRALSSELSVEDVLQKVADLSRELVGAAYGALGVIGEDGMLERFITSGISLRARERIGAPPRGRGVLGAVLKEGKPLRLAEISKHPESVGFPPHHPKMTSFLGVPVMLKGKVLGDLYLANKLNGLEFTQEDETLCTIFASQVAVAIENARLFDMERRRSRQLDLLNAIGKELTRTASIDELLKTLVDSVVEKFNYPSIQALWVDYDQEVLKVRATAGMAQFAVPTGAQWPLDLGITGWVTRHKATVLSNDVTQDPRYMPLNGFDSSAELAVPVILHDQVVAVLNVDAMEPGAFDQADVQTLETLADQISVFLAKIELQQKHEEQMQHLAVSEDRERIGRDLHDGIIQSIYAVGLELEGLSSQTDTSPGDIQKRIARAVDDLNQVIRDIRGYIMDLRPRELQGRRFDKALHSLIAYLKDRAGVSVDLQANFPLESLPDRYVVNFWHVFQETFSNIEKYSKATRVSISLTLNHQALELIITDDGIGFDQEKAESGRGYGLSSIKDRAERLGGVLQIKAAPGQGAQVHIKVPYNA